MNFVCRGNPFYFSFKIKRLLHHTSIFLVFSEFICNGKLEIAPKKDFLTLKLCNFATYKVSLHS